MNAVPIRPTQEEVMERAKEVKEKIEAAFHDVDVEYVDWITLSGDWPHWQARGFPPIGFGVDACLLIRGDLETTEKAASLADGEVARLLEETNVVIQIQRTNDVWCKKKVLLEIHTFVPGEPLKKGPLFIAREHPKGITFLCLMSEQHDHDFGRLQGKYREAS